MVTVETHLGVGNNILFLYSISLTTLQHYDVGAGFPADIFSMEKIMRETQRNPNSGGPVQRVWTNTVAWV